ncbi:TetR/AcrR family transcriptional regulator [Marinobacter zhejiangensis]|uniref:Transcriptional regulator, TetR family n=1 Tax=Marinobacter zhejiangensis TaxID=488535 RepID=A0A1I4L5U3_9GAMM|nr:TetR/AcrR family transcriptional regulator [Marinobacter zhejiangensis]SFL86027.1 transcriptional regulator, TetR family [Marinobacter zhejiangensis]
MAYRETEKMRLRKAETRQRILDCALQLVMEGGFRNAQVSQVARRAEIATGTIYRHFTAKEELFAEVFRTATRREVTKVGESLAEAGSVIERLEQALRQFAARALNRPMMAWALIAEPVDPKVEAERLTYRKAYAELFEQAIREGMNEGCLPPQDAVCSSTCLVGALAESLVGPLSPVQGSTDETSHTSNTETLVNGIVRFCLQGLTGTGR